MAGKQGEYSFFHLSGTETKTLLTEPGILHTIVVHKAATSIKICNSASPANTPPLVGEIFTTVGTYIYDANVTALTIVVTGSSADVTVTYAG